MADQNDANAGANPGVHLQEEMVQQQQMQNNFMNMRDRLFHTILVRAAITYSNNVALPLRKALEFIMLLTALSLLGLLLFVHFMSTRNSSNCLDPWNTTWPTDGIVHVEVIEHLKMLEYKEEWLRWYKRERSQAVSRFDLKDVLLYGPSSIPAEARERREKSVVEKWPEDVENTTDFDDESFEEEENTWLNRLLRIAILLIGERNYDVEETEEDYQVPFQVPVNPEDPYHFEAEAAFSEFFRQQYDRSMTPRTIYRMEYAQYYGLLRLPLSYRLRRNITTLHVRLDADAKCFGDSVMLYTLRNLIGYEEAVMTSLRKLAVNESVDDGGLGYMHNLDTNEHYHFVQHGMSKTSYITAAVVMVGFTFAISLLLRFSHHQIFVFILEVLHMFDTNQPIQFPAASLLTVILALVGMEAIMSEVFSDTSTAFYVILVVWIADQFDAICCQSQTSRRFWLRFFYLYQFFFYAYQYRFGGQYGGIALLASIAFVSHSMIYFFHHYEMPLILYQERLQRILSEIQASPRMDPPPPADVAEPAAGIPDPVIVVATPNQPSNENGSPQEDSSQEDSHDNSHDDSKISAPSTSASFSNSGPSGETESSRAPPPIPEERVAQEVVSEAIEELFPN